MSELGGRRLRTADLVTGVVLMAMGAAMLAGSIAMPTYGDRGTILTAPGIFPGIVAAVILALGGVLALRAARSPTQPGAAEEPAAPGFSLRPFLIGLALMVAAIGLLGPVDFRLVAAGFCIAFAGFFVDWTGNRTEIARRAGATALVVLIAAVLLPEAFQRIFLVTLP